MIPAGTMDRRIRIEQQSSTRDAVTGEVTGTWETVADLWAAVLTPRGSERFYEGEGAGTPGTVAAIVDLKFRIRYRAGIVPTQRVQFDGRTYDIKAVLPVGRNEGLDILAQARAE